MFAISFLDFYLSRFACTGPNDDAPNQLVIHFKTVLAAFKTRTWTHFDREKLASLKIFNPDLIRGKRSFDSRPEALWLGPALLRRSVLVVFESVRKCYYSYKVHKLLPMINIHLGAQFTFACAQLQKTMQKVFPEFAPKTRGRKRKLGSFASNNFENYDSVLLEGITARRMVAVLFKWKHLPVGQSSWHSIDFRVMILSNGG